LLSLKSEKVFDEIFFKIIMESLFWWGLFKKKKNRFSMGIF
jgi:hypothetical protein